MILVISSREFNFFSNKFASKNHVEVLPIKNSRQSIIKLNENQSDITQNTQRTQSSIVAVRGSALVRAKLQCV